MPEHPTSRINTVHPDTEFLKENPDSSKAESRDSRGTSDAKAKKFADLIREFKENKDIYGHTLPLLLNALHTTSEEEGVTEDILKNIVNDSFSAEWEGGEVSMERRADLLEKFYKALLVSEEKNLLKDMDVRLQEVHSLIDSMDVSDEQKKEWRSMLTLDIPKNAKVKIIHVNGGDGLNTKGEEEHIRTSMKGKCDVTVVSLDNKKLDKEQLWHAIRAEMTDADYDIIIPFFSAHGVTKSAQSINLGFTKLNAPDDQFYVVNEPEVPLPSNGEVGTEGKEHYRKAGILTNELLRDYPDFFRNPDKTPRIIKAGDIAVALGSDRIYALRPIRTPEELRSRISEYFAFKDNEQKYIGTNDLITLQKDVEKDTKAEFLYMFDCCFSGSATNDALAGLPNTRAILSSTAEDQVAWEGEKSRGAFMNEFFNSVGQGASFGEAFVRTDILLNYTHGSRSKQNTERGNGQMKIWQNPRAVFRKENGDLQKVSSLKKNNSSKESPLS